MGYDMYWVDDSDGSWVNGEPPRSYFRLNIFGMADYRAAMLALDMCYPTGDGPDFKHKHDAKGPDGQCTQCEQVLRDHPGDFKGIPAHKLCSNDGWHVTAIECTTAVEAWRRYVKIGTTPKLDKARTVGDVFVGARGVDMPDVLRITSDPYWEQWVAYLAEAAQHGGFRVF